MTFIHVLAMYARIYGLIGVGVVFLYGTDHLWRSWFARRD